MMFYDGLSNSSERLYMEIDSKEMMVKIEDYLDETDHIALGLKVKHVLKKPKEFKKMQDEFKIEAIDFLLILQNMFPEIFTKRMLTSLRKLYNENFIG